MQDLKPIIFFKIVFLEIYSMKIENFRSFPQKNFLSRLVLSFPFQSFTSGKLELFYKLLETVEKILDA